jgi:hypothetical protein
MGRMEEDIFAIRYGWALHRVGLPSAVADQMEGSTRSPGMNARAGRVTEPSYGRLPDGQRGFPAPHHQGRLPIPGEGLKPPGW